MVMLGILSKIASINQCKEFHFEAFKEEKHTVYYSESTYYEIPQIEFQTLSCSFLYFIVIFDSSDNFHYFT